MKCSVDYGPIGLSFIVFLYVLVFPFDPKGAIFIAKPKSARRIETLIYGAPLNKKIKKKKKKKPLLGTNSRKIV